MLGYSKPLDVRQFVLVVEQVLHARLELPARGERPRCAQVQQAVAAEVDGLVGEHVEIAVGARGDRVDVDAEHRAVAEAPVEARVRLARGAAQQRVVVAVAVEVVAARGLPGGVARERPGAVRPAAFQLQPFEPGLGDVGGVVGAGLPPPRTNQISDEVAGGFHITLRVG